MPEKQPTHPDEAAFVRALIAEPDDRTTRLVFADWLDERADPRAAWLRDDDGWEWISPELARWFALDPHDLPNGLLAVVEEAGGESASAARDLLRLLGSLAIPAIRAWIRTERGDPDYVDSILRNTPPPDLRPVPELIALLSAPDVNDALDAATDLRWHGAAAAPAIQPLLNAPDRPEFSHVRGDPFGDIIFETLGWLGSVALPAVPRLAAAAWRSDAAHAALVAIRPDPDLVYEHLTCDNDRSADIGVSLVARLSDDEVAALARIVRRCDGRKSEAAALTLGEMGKRASAAVPTMIEEFRRSPDTSSSGHYMRFCLARSFRLIGEPARDAVPALREVLAEYVDITPGDGDCTSARDAITEALAELDPTG